MPTTLVEEDEIVKRAAATLQQAFFILKEATWDSFIQKIDDTGKTIAIYDDDNRSERFNGWFCRFPNHLMKNQKQKNAVLSSFCCNDIGCMLALLEKLLEGIDIGIRESKVSLRDRQRKTIIVYPNGFADCNTYDHWLFQVVSNTSSNQWAIDITGAQYDIHDTCKSWQGYCDEQVDRVYLTRPSGPLREYIFKLAELKHSTAITFHVAVAAIECFCRTVDTCLANENLKWSHIMTMDEAEYVRNRDELLKVGKEAIEEFVSQKNLTKKRLKSERYDRRHEQEVYEKSEELYKQYIAH